MNNEPNPGMFLVRGQWRLQLALNVICGACIGATFASTDHYLAGDFPAWVMVTFALAGVLIFV